MSLTDWRNKIKPYHGNLYFAVLAALGVSLVWGLLNLYQLERAKVPIRIENAILAGEWSASSTLPTTPLASGAFVASKNGTKYYPVDCQSAKRIKSANRIYFNTATEAAGEGYEPAATCQ